MAYWTAVNDILVRLERNAIKAALAKPADRLSAEITIYNIGMLWPVCASSMNNRLVKADNSAPINRMRITPKRNTSKPPRKPPTRVLPRPSVFATPSNFRLRVPEILIENILNNAQDGI